MKIGVKMLGTVYNNSFEVKNFDDKQDDIVIAFNSEKDKYQQKTFARVQLSDDGKRHVIHVERNYRGFTRKGKEYAIMRAKELLAARAHYKYAESRDDG